MKHVSRPALYVAGPYTRPDPVENTHRAIKVGSAIYEHTEWVPFVPHLTLLWHAVDPHPLEFWYELDLHHMEVCAAVVRMPGASTGADAEIEHAKTIGLPIIEWESLPEIVRREWVLS